MSDPNTSSQPLNNIALVKSLDKLRESARCISDLRKWFTANPQALLGSVALPENATPMVKVSIRNADILDAQWNGGLLVTVETEVISYYEPLASLAHLVKDASKSDLTVFKHTSALTLPLQTWPFASALVAGTYIVNQIECRHQQPFPDFEDVIDEALDKHFDGYTIAKIHDMLAAGFLPLTPGGMPHESDIIDMLFMSRSTTPALSPPNDLYPSQ